MERNVRLVGTPVLDTKNRFIGVVQDVYLDSDTRLHGVVVGSTFLPRRMISFIGKNILLNIDIKEYPFLRRGQRNVHDYEVKEEKYDYPA